ncbi:microfibril-associated glycoprotein 4-like [Penaeus monodon]|uniref:microfibril-associated glycoprotein 4-like n=1 Tax=Penaeus monodon TaxID=6687 RepID=UPI0018A6D6D8|nr:microfibril-associated glycoprotein 4-like [Penaeus monodon]
MIAMPRIVAMLWAVIAVVGAAANEPLSRRATFPASSSETKQIDQQLNAILSTLTENHNQLQSSIRDIVRMVRRTHREIADLREDTDLILGQMYKPSCQDIAEGQPDHIAGKSQFATEGVYTIRPPKFKPKKVRCELGRGAVGWTVILARNDGREPFNRTFQDYKDGFGDPAQDHWIGLDMLHKLTTWEPHQLRAVMEDFDGSKTWVQYNVFRVDGPEDDYKLTAEEFEADSAAGDGLSIHNGMKFSTYDHDDDTNRDGNCAKLFGGGGGWWYNNCYHVLPTGTYRHSGGSEYGGVAWYPWRNVKHSLKSLTLLIRPRY